MKTKLPLSREYAEFVSELKTRIQSARISAARSVNRDLILLYWDIGRGILERQEKLGWGQSVVEMLAHDLQKAFPGISGFSARNLWDMRRFYAVYSDPQILRQAVAEFEKIDRLNDLPQPLAEIDTVAAQPRQRDFCDKLSQKSRGGIIYKSLIRWRRPRPVSFTSAPRRNSAGAATYC
jgi:hypothetical protein